MTRLYAALAIAVIGAGAYAGAAQSKAPDDQQLSETLAEVAPQLTESERAAVKARAQAYVPAFNRTKKLHLFNNKGFVSVRRVFKGVYCLKLPANLDKRKIVASVTVEWGNSFGAYLLASYFQTGLDCTAREVEVVTASNPFASGGGSFAPSDDVSFTIVIP